MEKWKKRGIDLLTSLIFGGREKISVVPYYPQKTRVWGREEGWFARTIPEKRGISSRRLYNMLCELENERRANIHRIKVLQGDFVICECHAPGYEGDNWHISHSMSKTVCGMVIGRLYDEGLIRVDMKLSEIFPEIPYRDKRFPLITVEHLLSMKSGVEFGEIGSVTEQSWTESFFASSLRFTPGERFSYNSMNTYILVRVAERVTGRDFGSLAEEYIFAPLGINNYLWEIGPEGSEKGGWGLYLSSESWAKIGHMLLSGGVFEGKRILSDEWISLATETKATVSKEKGSFNYAYQMWVGRSNDELLFSGMLGQNLWICPKNGITVVMNSGNNELFQASPALETVRKYLGGRIYDRLNYADHKLLSQKEASFFNSRRWARPLDRGRGLFYWLGLREGKPFNKEWNGILGSYVLTNNETATLPLVIRAMQNNLNSTLEEIILYRNKEGLYLDLHESGTDICIPIGLYGYEESVIDVCGEKYIARAVGEVFDGPDGREYRIEIILPETASVRRMVIRRRDNATIIIEMSETPSDGMAIDYLNEYSKSNSALSIALDLIERRMGKGTVEKTIKNTFNPVLIGVDKAAKGYEAILEMENKRLSSGKSTARLVRAVVDRFIREQE